MKMNRFFGMIWLAAAISLSFCACGDDKDEPKIEINTLEAGFFEIEKVEYQVSAEAQTIDVLIHTNVKASTKVINNVDESIWISIGEAQQSGKDYLKYQVSVKENTENEERTGVIVFTPLPIPGRMIGSSQIGSNTIIIKQAGATLQ